MQSEDGRIVISFNGEIYNTQQVRNLLIGRGRRPHSRCDTELLLLLYEEMGMAFLDHIQGMYAIVVLDTRTSEVLLVRDAVGQKPLYYLIDPDLGVCYFASTPQALNELYPNRLEIDVTSLGFVLVLGYVPAPYSSYKNVSSLEPGQWLTWNASTRQQRSGFHYRPPDLQEQELLSDTGDFGELLEEVTRQHLVGDVPVTLLLSGGIDSAAIASAAVRTANAPMRALTLEQEGEADPDVLGAKEVARTLKLEHAVLHRQQQSVLDLARETARLSSSPQGFSSLTTWLEVSQEATKYSKVAVSGDGGDEIFGGYTWYSETPVQSLSLRRSLGRLRSSSLDRAMDRFAQRSLLHGHLMKIFPRFLPSEIPLLLGIGSESEWEERVIEYLRGHFSAVMPVQAALQRMDLLSFCSNHICAKTDQMSMGCSLEIRAPLLDQRVIDWAFSRQLVQGSGSITGNKSVLRRVLRSYGTDTHSQFVKRGFSRRGTTWPVAEITADLVKSRVITDIFAPDFLDTARRRSRYRNARFSVLWNVANWYEAQHIRGIGGHLASS